MNYIFKKGFMERDTGILYWKKNLGLEPNSALEMETFGIQDRYKIRKPLRCRIQSITGITWMRDSTDLWNNGLVQNIKNSSRLTH